MLSEELEYTRKPDGGLSEQIEVLEAFADGDADNTELLMLLIELRSLREQLAELKALEPAAWMDEKGNVCTIDNRLRGLTAECADAYRKYNIPLFTASKPAED
ncbi:hypothetical protein DVP71_18230 [Yersinia enterocolitica]|nr:hypothetical protein [Yersinia enterocolitica]